MLVSCFVLLPACCDWRFRLLCFFCSTFDVSMQHYVQLVYLRKNNTPWILCTTLTIISSLFFLIHPSSLLLSYFSPFPSLSVLLPLPFFLNLFCFPSSFTPCNCLSLLPTFQFLLSDLIFPLLFLSLSVVFNVSHPLQNDVCSPSALSSFFARLPFSSVASLLLSCRSTSYNVSISPASLPHLSDSRKSLPVLLLL